MINIITSFYVSKYSSDLDGERSNELISALLFNINLDIVEKIHLFVDDEESLRLRTLVVMIFQFEYVIIFLG